MLKPFVFGRRSTFLFAIALALSAGPGLVAEDTGLAVAHKQSGYFEESITALSPQLGLLDAEAAGRAFAAAEPFRDLYRTEEKAGYVVPFSHGCNTSGTLSCGQTLSGTITNHGCETNSGSAYLNFYTFSATAGQQITLTVRSTVIDPLIIMLDGTGAEVGRDNDSGGGRDALFTATVTQTGQFSVGVYALRSTGASTGSYTISLICSSTGTSCTANSTTLCLSSGRFKVQTRWATSNGQSGDGQAVAITGDTGYFWFFNSANVEMVLKVLNACPSRYWVFAGGLTNVQVTMTVTDTSRGTVKTYSNPQGQAFQPIQDTNAFATCP